MLLVFDFDGTLMDTLRDLAEAASDLAESYGGARLSEADAAAMIGDGASVFVQRILATAGLDRLPPGAVARYLDFYERRVFDHTVPYPGVVEMLQALAGGHRLALLSNKPEASARALMRQTQIESWFRDCVFGDGALERKPDPAGLRWLMSRAETDPSGTMMIGDSTMDLDVARAAGTRLCLARYGFGFSRIPADRIEPDDLVIDRPMELVDRLGAFGPPFRAANPLAPLTRVAGTGPNMPMRTDASGWTGEGAFTPVLLEALQAIDAIVFLKIEDAPSSRVDAGYALIANEIYLQFRIETRVETVTRFGFIPGTRRVETPSMTLAALGDALASVEGVGAPDYSDDGMLQYLRTERIVPPYQTRGVKVVEMVRIYEAGSRPRS